MIAEVAAQFDFGIASVVRWIKDVDRKPKGFHKRKIDLDVLRQGYSRLSRCLSVRACCPFARNAERCFFWRSGSLA